MFSPDEADPNSLFLMRQVTIKNGENLLDLGCGYGLIGTTLGKLHNIGITMSDVNGFALSYAKKNADYNGVKASYFKSDGFSEISGSFDVITLNPPIHAGKEVCFKLYTEVTSYLTESGRFYTVIMDKHGAKSHLKKLYELYAKIDTIKQNGVNIIICKK
jgi:16S rRNA (guanine1207-N2)-methyltransferase